MNTRYQILNEQVELQEQIAWGMIPVFAGASIITALTLQGVMFALRYGSEKAKQIMQRRMEQKNIAKEQQVQVLMKIEQEYEKKMAQQKQTTGQQVPNQQ